MGALRPLIWRGDRVECPCCGGRFERFLPYWNRDFCRCPRCDSHERHRALWLYLRDRADLAGTLLHLAPEAAIARHLRDRPGVDYVSADLDSPLAMLHFDIQDIPFRDGTFDAVLCGHVLTEVPDDRKAMREMARVLRPGGRLLLVDHVAASASALRAVQWLYERITIPLAGEHFRRRPLTYVRELGFEVEEAERFRLGIVERVSARKPG